MIKVKYKKLVKHAMEPVQINEGDVGFDLYAIDYSYDSENDFHEFGTGLAFEIPPNYFGLLFPRSSISKTPLALANGAGIIDSGYRGEVTFRFRKTNNKGTVYSVGDRIGQIIIMPYPKVVFEEADWLSDSQRGTRGYGSSDR